jgi:hypothetical protein
MRLWKGQFIAKCSTFFAVLFLRSRARSTTLQLGRMYSLATYLTQEGTVAENKQICRSLVHYFLTKPKIRSMSSLKPNLSI